VIYLFNDRSRPEKTPAFNTRGISDVAIRTLVIVRQNLRWAVIYNMTALPLAAIGLMPPWVAALGMSLSSLLVVFNARRILRASQPAIGAA